LSISYLLVLLGLAVLGGATWALFWAIDSGQYDDLEAQGRSILDPPDDEDAPRGGPPTG
jgi:cbb3-type cytochrome oxidase maturation protein